MGKNNKPKRRKGPQPPYQRIVPKAIDESTVERSEPKAEPTHQTSEPMSIDDESSSEGSESTARPPHRTSEPMSIDDDSTSKGSESTARPPARTLEPIPIDDLTPRGFGSKAGPRIGTFPTDARLFGFDARPPHRTSEPMSIDGKPTPARTGSKKGKGKEPCIGTFPTDARRSGSDTRLPYQTPYRTFPPMQFDTPTPERSGSNAGPSIGTFPTNARLPYRTPYRTFPPMQFDTPTPERSGSKAGPSIGTFSRDEPIPRGFGSDARPPYRTSYRALPPMPFDAPAPERSGSNARLPHETFEPMPIDEPMSKGFGSVAKVVAHAVAFDSAHPPPPTISDTAQGSTVVIDPSNHQNSAPQVRLDYRVRDIVAELRNSIWGQIIHSDITQLDLYGLDVLTRITLDYHTGWVQEQQVDNGRLWFDVTSLSGVAGFWDLVPGLDGRQLQGYLKHISSKVTFGFTTPVSLIEFCESLEAYRHLNPEWVPKLSVMLKLFQDEDRFGKMQTWEPTKFPHGSPEKADLHVEEWMKALPSLDPTMALHIHLRQPWHDYVQLQKFGAALRDLRNDLVLITAKTGNWPNTTSHVRQLTLGMTVAAMEGKWESHRDSIPADELKYLQERGCTFVG